MPTTGRGIFYPQDSDQVNFTGDSTASPGDLGRMAISVDGALPVPYVRGALASGDDLFELPVGIYWFSSDNASSIANVPEERPSTVEVVQAQGASIKTIRVFPYQRDYWFWTVTNSASDDTMMPWQKIDIAGGISAGSRHEVRKEAATRRKGGVIGTGGRAVVALRFDHGLANFRDKVLPELKRLGLPSTLAMNSQRWGHDETGGMTADQLNTEALNAGVEVWNHGRTHGDASTRPALTREIVDGLVELREQLPDCPIDGFVVPGVGADGYGGFSGGSTPDRWDTLAGQLIMASHGFATGYMPGRYRTIAGIPCVGLTHHTMDQESFATMRDSIDAAIRLGAAVTIMLHPSVLDGDGNITTAKFVSGLEHLAARRDAGDVVAVTVGGSLVADRGSDLRVDVVPPMTVASSVAAGGRSGRSGQLVGREHFRGVQVEIVADVDMSADGTVDLSVDGLDTQQRQMDAGRGLVRRCASVPMGANDFTVWASPSVDATVHQISVTPC